MPKQDFLKQIPSLTSSSKNPLVRNPVPSGEGGTRTANATCYKSAATASGGDPPSARWRREPAQGSGSFIRCEIMLKSIRVAIFFVDNFAVFIRNTLH